MKALKDITPEMENKIYSVYMSCKTEDHKDTTTDWIRRTFGNPYVIELMLKILKERISVDVDCNTEKVKRRLKEVLIIFLQANGISKVFESVSKETIYMNFINNAPLEVPQPEMIITKGFKDVQ